MERSKPKIRRCAIYTRKSSEEGLEQEFNSLHAQREACEAFIKSQAGEGWRLVRTHYDDGGLSGATMERPALQRLMADIDKGLVDAVVVYKVDRFTRSLADFAKMVEVFDARGVSFVAAGRFHDAAAVNARAVKVDQAFFASSKESGVYPLVYYTHNIHFLCYARMIEGRQHDALASARVLETKVPLDAVRAMPMAEFLVPMPYFVEVRFGMWDEILKEPAPPKDLPYTSAMWHYARALVFSAKGNRAQAANEQRQLETIAATIPPDRPLGTSNHARDVAQVAAAVLAGELAAAHGDRKDAAAKLMAMGRTREAETVYREDLRINPGNPRSLYGLAQCLSAQGKTAEAAEAR